MPAQVAGQEGKYLASLFASKAVQPDKPLPASAKPFRCAVCPYQRADARLGLPAGTACSRTLLVRAEPACHQMSRLTAGVPCRFQLSSNVAYIGGDQAVMDVPKASWLIRGCCCLLPEC